MVDSIFELLIILVIPVGGVICLAIVLSLILICINCIRCSRIHKQMPIEYLNPQSSDSESSDYSSA